MKNFKNIIEQKYPPENPNDLWMKDDVLYKSTHKGWTPLTAGGGSSTNGVISTTWLELKDKRDAGKLIPGTLYRITDYNCTTTQENTRSAGHQFDIVLLALSENKLAEEGWAMMNESNIYDVTFLDGVTKKCWIYKLNSTECNVVPIDNVPTGVVAVYNDTFPEIDIDEDNKTANSTAYSTTDLTEENLTYNYFQNSNLSAWKVWYCLDNDTDRFAWADDTRGGNVINIYCNDKTSASYSFYYDSIVTINGQSYIKWNDLKGMSSAYTPGTDKNIVKIGDQLYAGDGTTPYQIGNETFYITSIKTDGTGGPNGRGVIYRLIDEWNIDYPCDFKNMQTLIPMDSNDDIDMQNPATSKYCYAFTDNTSGDPEDLSIKGHAINIKVKARLIEDANSAMYFSPSTLFYTNSNEGNTCRFSDITVGTAYTTIFINKGYKITILDASSNVMLKDCSTICIGYNSGNIIFDTVIRSTFGSNCQNIQLTGENDLNYGNGGVELATKDDLN